MDMEAVAEALALPDAGFWSKLKLLISQEALLVYAGILIKVVIVIAAVMVIRRILCHFIDKAFRNKITMGLVKASDTLEEKRLHTLAKMFKSIVSYVLYFIGIITCLDMVGFSITTIVAGAGIVSLAVAFGAQSIVQDLMSGIFIILENQYAVGDIITIDTTTGTVKEIGMKTTKIMTFEGQLMVISNGSVQKVVNYSRAAQRGFVDVGIAYEEALDNAYAVMEKACGPIAEKYAEDLDETPHVIGAIDLANSAVIVRVTFTAYRWQQLPIERELRKALKDALDQAGIEISYPKVQLIGKEY